MLELIIKSELNLISFAGIRSQPLKLTDNQVSSQLTVYPGGSRNTPSHFMLQKL